jgi:hypothetical protein
MTAEIAGAAVFSGTSHRVMVTWIAREPRLRWLGSLTKVVNSGQVRFKVAITLRRDVARPHSFHEENRPIESIVSQRFFTERNKYKALLATHSLRQLRISRSNYI